MIYKMLEMKYLKLIFIFALMPFSAFSQDKMAKVHPSVWNSMKDGKGEFFVILKSQADLSSALFLPTKEEKGAFVFNTLKAHAEKSQVNIQNYLNAQTVDFQSFWVFNCLYLTGDLALIQNLAGREDVAQIVNNPKSQLSLPPSDNSVLATTLSPRNAATPTWGVLAIKADQVWAQGYRGQNVVIGGADTGYGWEHPALKTKYRGWNAATGKVDHNYSWHDAIHANNSLAGNPCGYDTKAPCDDQQHGSHTMGTMTGATDSLAIGVAPDAKWLGARNMDRGNGTLARYVECFQWFIAPTDTANKLPDPKKAPHVINNSWYCDATEGCNASNYSVMEAAVNACRAAGIVVVISAGNSGSGCSTVSEPPAFFAKSFAIGATRQDDTIAGFSSRGPVATDGSNRLKPNVSAPGVGVLSSVPLSGGAFGYASFSGTSMSGPHVAGTVALMISANPALAGQVDTIERILELTAKKMTTLQDFCGIKANVSPNFVYGFGRIDALEAVKKGLLYKAKVTQIIENQSVVKISPNPFSNEITIYTEGVLGETLIEIFNANGQIILSKKENFNLKNTTTVTLSNAAAGIYFYKIRSERGVAMSGKLVKM